MSNVRVGKDLVTYFQNGVELVHARSGGISTFSSLGPGRNWWVLAEGYEYPEEIEVINDHGNHYNWEPTVDLPLIDFVALLAKIETAFTKFN